MIIDESDIFGIFFHFLTPSTKCIFNQLFIANSLVLLLDMMQIKYLRSKGFINDGLCLISSFFFFKKTVFSYLHRVFFSLAHKSNKLDLVILWLTIKMFFLSTLHFFQNCRGNFHQFVFFLMIYFLMTKVFFVLSTTSLKI